MSIEKRVGPFSRAFRSLIRKHADRAKSIKDLKVLRILRVCACYRHSGLTDLQRRRDVFLFPLSVVRDRLIPNGQDQAILTYRSDAL